jgi:hypothetical protein
MPPVKLPPSITARPLGGDAPADTPPAARRSIGNSLRRAASDLAAHARVSAGHAQRLRAALPKLDIASAQGELRTRWPLSGTLSSPSTTPQSGTSSPWSTTATSPATSLAPSTSSAWSVGSVQSVRPGSKLDAPVRPPPVAHESPALALQQARLADDAYEQHVPGQNNVEGWRDVSRDPEALARLGLTEQDLQPDNASGFRARLYLPERGSPNEHLPPQLAFRGTASGSDVKADLRAGLGLRTDHFDKAGAIGAKLAQLPPGSVQLVGHSLGGGLASAAALVSGQPATTFDAMGLHEAERRRLAAKSEGGLHTGVTISAFHMRSEALTSVQRNVSFAAEALGTAVSVPAAPAQEPRSSVTDRLKATIAPDRFKGHMMTEMIKSLEHANESTGSSPTWGLRTKERPDAVPPFAYLQVDTDAALARLNTMAGHPMRHAVMRSRLADEAQCVIEFAAQKAQGIAPQQMHFSRGRVKVMAEDFAGLAIARDPVALQEAVARAEAMLAAARPQRRATA